MSVAEISRDDLVQFVKSPAWLWFVAQVHREWGAGGVRFEATLNQLADSRQDDAMVMQQIRQIAVARREILRLVQLPEEHIATLGERSGSTHPRPEPDRAVAGQSRRGGL